VGTVPRITPQAAAGVEVQTAWGQEEQPPGATPDSGLQEAKSQAVIWNQKPASVPCPRLSGLPMAW
jgi:hypothetical protein